MIQAGNLDGLSMHIMYDALNPFIYAFPAIEVTTGEYITLHLQTFESVCVNETGDDLSASGGKETSPVARDLWVSGTAKLLHQTDIVYVQDANGRIMDAVVMNEMPSIEWNSNQAHFAEITDRLFNAGMWQSSDGSKPSPFDSVNTSAIGKTTFKSVSRCEGRENTHSAKDWYITNTGDITPGEPNQ